MRAGRLPEEATEKKKNVSWPLQRGREFWERVGTLRIFYVLVDEV